MDRVVCVLWQVVPKIIPTRCILEHGAANCGEVLLSSILWADLSVWSGATFTRLRTGVGVDGWLLSEENSSSSWWDGVQTLLRHATSWDADRLGSCWSGDCCQILPLIATWSWYFTHLLHLFHIGEPLRCRGESISWILSQELLLFAARHLIQKGLIHAVKSLRVMSFLEGQAKCWLCHVLIRWIKFGSPGFIKELLRRSCISTCCAWWHAFAGESFTCYKSLIGWGENSILVGLGQFLMLINSIQECISLLHYFLILNWYHLIEVNCLSLIFNLWLLIAKSDCSRPKRLKMISCAQLIVQYFELVLNLGIIATRSWIKLLLFRYLVHEFSQNWRIEGVAHLLFWWSKAWAHLLQNCVLLFRRVLIRLVLIWRWTLEAGWIGEWWLLNVSVE